MRASIPAPASRRQATRPAARSEAGWSLVTAGALKFVARFDHNSTELTLLKAQTTGTAVIHLQFDANNSLDITWQKVAFATGEVGETDQIVTVAVEATPIYEALEKLLTAIESGASRGLRTMGIFVDLNKEVDRQEKLTGRTLDENEVRQQRVRMHEMSINLRI